MDSKNSIDPYVGLFHIFMGTWRVEVPLKSADWVAIFSDEPTTMALVYFRCLSLHQWTIVGVVLWVGMPS